MVAKEVKEEAIAEGEAALNDTAGVATEKAETHRGRKRSECYFTAHFNKFELLLYLIIH
jgi:hypothetical protein